MARPVDYIPFIEALATVSYAGLGKVGPYIEEHDCCECGHVKEYETDPFPVKVLRKRTPLDKMMSRQLTKFINRQLEKPLFLDAFSKMHDQTDELIRGTEWSFHNG